MLLLALVAVGAESAGRAGDSASAASPARHARPAAIDRTPCILPVGPIPQYLPPPDPPGLTISRGVGDRIEIATKGPIWGSAAIWWEWSSDLKTWAPVPSTAGATNSGPTFINGVPISLTQAGAAAPRRFYRFKLYYAGYPWSYPPVINQQPQDQDAMVGHPVTFSVQAVGLGPLSYQWLKDCVPIPGATLASLTIVPKVQGDGGRYGVEVLSNFGRTVSENAALTVESWE